MDRVFDEFPDIARADGDGLSALRFRNSPRPCGASARAAIFPSKHKEMILGRNAEEFIRL